jgi:hypothetical protein
MLPGRAADDPEAPPPADEPKDPPPADDTEETPPHPATSTAATKTASTTKPAREARTPPRSAAVTLDVDDTGSSRCSLTVVTVMTTLYPNGGCKPVTK